jgi:hypothetical protein
MEELKKGTVRGRRREKKGRGGKRKRDRRR